MWDDRYQLLQSSEMRMLAPERTLDDSLLIAFYRNNRLVGDNLAAAGVGNGETVAVGPFCHGRV